MGALPPYFFPWNPSYTGASFKHESLASLAGGTLMDACYGEPTWQAPALAAVPLPRARLALSPGGCALVCPRQWPCRA